MPGVLNLLALQHILADITYQGDDSATLSNCQLCLYQNDFIPTPSFVDADLVEADFTGYSSVECNTWGTPLNQGNAQAATFNEVFTFLRTAGATSNTIYGWYIKRNDDNVIVYAERLSESVPMENPGDILHVLPVIRLQNAADV